MMPLCDVTVLGHDLYPFINAVRESRIICLEQRCRGEQFLCRIRSCDVPELREIAAAYGLTAEIRERPSLLRRFRHLRLRFGLAIGAVLAVALIFWQSNTVEIIDVEGNAQVSDTAILAILAQEGVERGSWIPRIDMPGCEYAIRMRLSGIAWCGIRHYGNHLIVEVAEETPQVPMLHERSPCNILAAQDAQITGVKVHVGYLQRLIGDGVAKGDLLVSGVFEDANGITTFRHAIAEIRGIYTKEATFSAAYTIETREPTGRSFRQHYLRLFGMQIPLTIGRPPFVQMDQERSEVSYSFLNLRLPCSLVTVTSTEQEIRTVTRTPQEAKLALQADIVRYEKNLLGDVEIRDRQLHFSEDENGLTCTAVYTVEGEIGITSEFMVYYKSSRIKWTDMELNGLKCR